MPVNLLNEKDLNNYLTDIVYQGQETPSYTSGDFKSIDYVRQNKDGIAKAILAQYIKHRLRSHLVDKADAPFLSQVQMSDDLPVWAQRSIAEGRDVFRFNAANMTNTMRNDITEVRDFLYSAADNYIDKTLATAEHTKQSPKLRLDYLKTNNEYDTFEKALNAAHKWHEIMAQRAEKIARDKELFEKSLKGTEFVMDLPDGMAAYRLTTAEALDFESEYMGHCVGRGGYDEGVRDGRIQIYSIRDKNGEPHATFEVRGNEIHQCKGKANKAPIAKYRSAVQEFVRQRRFDIKGDVSNTGLIHQDGQYYDMYHLPKGFVVKANLDFSVQDITELPDLSGVVVEGYFDCSRTKITSLKGAPQSVSRYFDCSHTQITSLEGAPQKVGGDFDCSHTKITSLSGAPQEVGGDFDCSNTQITLLTGAPQKVDGSFYCYYSELTSLEGAPTKTGGGFDCSFNRKLTSLMGTPQHIKGTFNCSYTKITSLAGAPQSVGKDFYCSDTQITSLEGAPQSIGGRIDCLDTQIKDKQAEIEKVRKGFYNKRTALKDAIQKNSSSNKVSSAVLKSVRGNDGK